MCPALPDPVNGAVTWPSLTVGSIATYTCDDGFELEGSMTRTCESSAMWSGDEPICIGMFVTFPSPAPFPPRMRTKKYTAGLRDYFTG